MWREKSILELMGMRESNLCSEEGVHEEEQLLQLWTDHLLRHLDNANILEGKVGSENDDLLLDYDK